jgi:predicted DNA-binding antitoxin AbrB/MazE fold protein
MVRDKTQLERDIERRELVKKPLSVLILIAFLSVSLGALGVYTFKLKQKLSIKEQEIVLIKSNFDKEKAELLNKIRRLEREHTALESDLEPLTDKSNPMSETKTPMENVKKTDEK